jgi:hypothetical protein
MKETPKLRKREYFFEIVGITLQSKIRKLGKGGVFSAGGGFISL